jgi:hypothetical protein
MENPFPYIWYAFYGLVLFCGVGGIAYLVNRQIRWNAAKPQRAQQEAVIEHNAVTRLLFDMGQRSLTTHQQITYEHLAVDYAHFHMSGHGDPTMDHLSIAAYERMYCFYARMKYQLRDLPTSTTLYADHRVRVGPSGPRHATSGSRRTVTRRSARTTDSSLPPFLYWDDGHHHASADCGSHIPGDEA